MKMAWLSGMLNKMACKPKARYEVWLIAALAICCAGFWPVPSMGQDWIKTGTGLGIEKARVAVADFAPRKDTAKSHAALFGDVVRGDLDYSGIIEVVSKSFYPVQVPSAPGELNHKAWTDPAASAHLLAFGNLNETASEVSIEAWLYDVRNPAAPAVIGKVYRGDASDAQVRRFAHQFADEIISKLSGGVPGVASTQIAFVSSRTGFKEIWLMDYDGANQHALTSLRSISLTPRWSPDVATIAFTCFAGYRGVVTPQICLFSMATGKPVTFPRFAGTNSSPAFSPDGSKIIFSSSMQGNPELFLADANGGRPKRLTFATGANTSAAWNPKTGATVAFVSDRGGIPQLYMMDADGSNIAKVDLPDMGYVIDPAWSPNGQLLAFSWRRPTGNYDLYLMDVATRKIVELTRDAGRNERPSWAPDGRHIVFESTRSGSRQIWTMLADGSQVHQLTSAGHNESPNWSLR